MADVLCFLRPAGEPPEQKPFLCPNLPRPLPAPPPLGLPLSPETNCPTTLVKESVRCVIVPQLSEMLVGAIGNRAIRPGNWCKLLRKAADIFCV